MIKYLVSLDFYRLNMYNDYKKYRKINDEEE